MKIKKNYLYLNFIPFCLVLLHLCYSKYTIVLSKDYFINIKFNDYLANKIIEIPILDYEITMIKFFR